LLDCLRSGAHLHLGFGCFGEYVERLLGYGRRSIDERLRVAEALERLPSLAQALRDGRVIGSVVRELTRVAIPENEDAWLEVVRGRTVRQVEELVAGHQPGDRPRTESPLPSVADKRVRCALDAALQGSLFHERALFSLGGQSGGQSPRNRVLCYLHRSIDA